MDISRLGAVCAKRQVRWTLSEIFMMLSPEDMSAQTYKRSTPGSNCGWTLRTPEKLDEKASQTTDTQSSPTALRCNKQLKVYSATTRFSTSGAQGKNVEHPSC